jgi:hypothetical protein
MLPIHTMAYSQAGHVICPGPCSLLDNHVDIATELPVLQEALQRYGATYVPERIAPAIRQQPAYSGGLGLRSEVAGCMEVEVEEDMAATAVQGLDVDTKLAYCEHFLVWLIAKQQCR